MSVTSPVREKLRWRFNLRRFNFKEVALKFVGKYPITFRANVSGYWITVHTKPKVTLKYNNLWQALDFYNHLDGYEKALFRQVLRGKDKDSIVVLFPYWIASPDGHCTCYSSYLEFAREGTVSPEWASKPLFRPDLKELTSCGTAFVPDYSPDKSELRARVPVGPSAAFRNYSFSSADYDYIMTKTSPLPYEEALKVQLVLIEKEGIVTERILKRDWETYKTAVAETRRNK